MLAYDVKVLIFKPILNDRRGNQRNFQSEISVIEVSIASGLSADVLAYIFSKLQICNCFLRAFIIVPYRLQVSCTTNRCNNCKCAYLCVCMPMPTVVKLHRTGCFGDQMD